jgi:hypothetical protein
VDHAKKTVTFRYKSWLNVRTKEKSYKTVTMDIYEFMAKMLFFLPKKHQKMIRYYGIYAHGAGEKLKKIQNATWKATIEHSFNTDPEKCPDCGTDMHPSVVFGYNAEQVWYRMRREYCLYKGYFRPMKRGP